MRITRIAEALNALPYDGGLLDQPPGALFRMEAILAASSQPQTAEANKLEAQQKAERRARGVRR